MKTYIPKQPKQPRERLEVKLERSLLQKLELYCEYLDSDREYVLGSILRIVFKKDKGFDEWLGSQGRDVPVPVPSVPTPRRTAAGD